MSEPDFDSLVRVAGPVSRETFARLQQLHAQFLRWARVINLASPATLGDVWSRHILDSAQLLPLADTARNWLDLGSGGGFPGAVLAVLLADRPGASIDLVESNRKKAAFLATTLGALDAPARVHARRVEDCVALVANPEIVTARALAPLPKLLSLAEPWLAGGARALFHKGRDYRGELEESAAGWRFDLVEHPSCVDPTGVILDIRNLRRAER